MFRHGGATPCSVGDLVDVGEAHLLHRVQVVEVAPVLLEAMHRRRGIGVVAQVILAELAGGVAQVQQELGDARGSRLQVGQSCRTEDCGGSQCHSHGYMPVTKAFQPEVQLCMAQ